MGKVKKKQLVDKVKLEVVGGSTAPNSNKKKQYMRMSLSLRSIRKVMNLQVKSNLQTMKTAT